MPASRRSFVLRHTRLRPVPGLGGVRLHLADDALALWRAVQLETGDPDTPLPFWGFAWGGGLALARFLGERPAAVRGRRVLDVASGSGLCAIVAMLAGASGVTAVDIDPFAIAAIEVNAKANGVRLAVARRDVLDDAPPPADVVLAADWAYEERLAGRVLPWLQRAALAGSEVLIGDPGRRYLPVDALEQLAVYEVRTTTELEDLALKRGRVYGLRPAG
ncbi:MAG TPA: 50S ribosomal protein L11 methyltransferase [Candidatus Dormibacteraeota bacterium]|nr:50S ribosomal protein L11 methyltransferase [Candidatus Dormibacteraeota bacterium]